MARPPASIGRYEVVRPIGQGGMGSLFLAWDPKLERQIAIKLLKDDDDQLRERFSREARSVARLRHPHIVTIFDVGDHEGQPFIAMEFVQGETLGEIIGRRRTLPLPRKVELIEELCDGLGFAHKAGIVHRDIKPANIMIDGSGSLKILDFGIARAAEASGLTQAGMLIGTLNYMSPEQVNGDTVDHRSDIFAVGAVFYELIAYRQAFPGAMLGGVINKILHESPTPLAGHVPDVPADIVRIVDRALQKDPAQRYQDLAAMRKELTALRLQLELLEPPMALADPVPLGPEQPTEQRPAIAPPKFTPTPTPTPTPAPGPRAAEREEIARRRSGQIQAHLERAEAALARGDFESAVTSCEDALLLNADDPRGIELLDRARAGLEREQAKDWLESAASALNRGELTTAREFVDRAAALDPAAAGAQDLGASIDRAFADRARARDRDAAVRKTLDEAHASFDAGVFDEVIELAASALSLDPDCAEARELRTRATHARNVLEKQALDRRAQEAVSQARQLFAHGDHAAAFDHLARFEPAHDLITRTADELRAEAARIAERLRAEAEQRARHERQAAEAAEKERLRQERLATEAAERDRVRKERLAAEAAERERALQRERERARASAVRADPPAEVAPTIVRSSPLTPEVEPTIVSTRPPMPAPSVPVPVPRPAVPTEPRPDLKPRADRAPAAVGRADAPSRTEPSSLGRYLAIAAVVVVVVGGLTAYLTLGSDPEPPPADTAPITSTIPIVAPPPTVPPVPEPVGGTGGRDSDRGRGERAPDPVEPVLVRARQQYGNGDRAGALATAMTVWPANRQDPRLQTFLSRLIDDARADASRAQSRADAVDPARSSTNYQEARNQQSVAEQSARAGRSPDAAIKGFQAAATLYDKAAEEGRRPVRQPDVQVVTSVPVAQIATSVPVQVPPPPPPPPPPQVDERVRVLETLREYARAFSAKSVPGVLAVYRTDAARLDAAYKRVRTQALTFRSNPTIQVTGNSATATCSVRLESVSDRGEQSDRNLSMRFQLEKDGSRWIITSIGMQ